MRDIWAVPPGGRDVERRDGPPLRPAIAITLVILLGLGGVTLYVAMKRSTPVSAADAIARFRAEREPAGGKARREASRVGEGSVKTHAPREKSAAPKSSPSSPVRPTGPAGTTADDAMSPRSGGATRSSQRSQPPLPRPAEGVYEWDVNGYETVPGLRRDLPRRSHRIITREGRRGWVEHHLFSEQREEWFTIRVDRAGVVATAVRNRVEMGPVEEDRTVVYDPPVYIARFPLKVGDTWRATFSGETYGSYTGRTFDHTTMTVDGRRLEVWGTEIVMQMEGEIEGDVTVRTWVSIETGLVLKQYQEMEVRTGPASYYTEWTGHLVSLNPRT